jgi:transcriptional regulator with XRE-family HTH domain
MEEEALAGELGSLIRRLRLERGYSQAGFAEVCKIDRAHMGEIERGDINVTVRTALKIAKGLGMSLAGLFEELERNQ